MDNSVSTPLKQHSLHAIDLGLSSYLYGLSNLLPVAATALVFFLPYYFITALRFSLLQGGLLISFYGIGIFIAILLNAYLKRHHTCRKIVLFALFTHCIAVGAFLVAKTFLPLSATLLFLGFSGYLFKNNHAQLLLQQPEDATHTQIKIVQESYIASSLGLGLAMLFIALFNINNFSTLFMSAIVLNALPLFFLPKGTPSIHKLAQARTPAPTLSNIFSLLLLFLGGLILSQFTATYGIYLCLKFPHGGLRSMAVFMLLNVFLVAWLQKPMLTVFSRGSPILRSACGALLIGLGCYIGSLAHLFSLVVLSAMIVSLGEIFFISSLYSLCHRRFQATLALSLIIGASVGATVYQFFGANILWQSCAYIGMLCFMLALFYHTFYLVRRIFQRS